MAVLGGSPTQSVPHRFTAVPAPNTSHLAQQKGPSDCDFQRFQLQVGRESGGVGGGKEEGGELQGGGVAEAEVGVEGGEGEEGEAAVRAGEEEGVVAFEVQGDAVDRPLRAGHVRYKYTRICSTRSSMDCLPIIENRGVLKGYFWLLLVDRLDF